MTWKSLLRPVNQAQNVMQPRARSDGGYLRSCYPTSMLRYAARFIYPAANALTWKKGGHNIAFHAYEIATSNVEDRDGAEKELKGLIDLVNRHLGTPRGDYPRHKHPPTSHVDGNLQVVTPDQLQTMRRAHLLYVRSEAGSITEETGRLPASV